MSKKQETVVNLTDTPISEILKEIQQRGYYVARTPETRRGQTFIGDLSRWTGAKYTFAVVADTHLGSKYQQITHLNTFYSICAKRRIPLVLHVGDLTEGNGKMYRGQVYEMFAQGADAQRDYVVNNYPKRKGITTYVISGNHDQSFIKTDGYNIVMAICQQRTDMVYIGDDVAYYMLGNIKIMLAHGTSGNAYAVSYKSQKLVEALPGGEKPHLLFLGHYHNPNIIPGYRNVETVQMPAFQASTPYMRAKGLHSFVAGLIVTIQEDKSGLAKVIYEMIPFYVHKKDDF
jgi:predicted phosphodiesterase